MTTIGLAPVADGLREPHGYGSLAALVSEVATALMRDPRVHPRKGDVLDDDPPLIPLTVVAVWPNEDEPREVVAERRQWWLGHMLVRGRWKGSLAAWQREMVRPLVVP